MIINLASAAFTMRTIATVFTAGMMFCSLAGAGADVETTATVSQPLDANMGDWAPANDGSPVAQVIALGDGNYRANILPAFDVRTTQGISVEGKLQGEEILFESPQAKIKIHKGVLSGTTTGANASSFEMKRVVRTSPTLGKEPPVGAVVLFDGRDLSKWTTSSGQLAPWKLIDGAMEVVPKSGSVFSTEKFVDAQIHLEFRTPFYPSAKGQKRGNSGVYLKGMYEIQILDSYGLEGAENECGGMYKAAAPRVNMCAPPGQWQTYDIAYRSPRYDVAGKKTSNAVISVRHNGVVIHEMLQIPDATPGGLSRNESEEPGPVFLQDHGDLVQFRNIWAVRLGEITH